MNEPKKLIEVALPIKEVSAESVRDKSIRHGHISTLHLWWARRPLPVCRAVVFASLVPDPLDKNCPQVFKEAVAKLLADPQYKPYDDIPWTAIVDPMEDNLRNRLLCFIGKFSNKFIENEKAGKSTPTKDKLADSSLIKWDNKNNKDIIAIARKLIFVAHNADSKNSCKTLLDDFNQLFLSIATAENCLYQTENRHIETNDIKLKQQNLSVAIDNFLDKMPKVFDPFAGGGAIPLEAARLGCRTFGNDINPVAHIIQRGSLEFPQKYGKPLKISKNEFIKTYGDEFYKEIKKDDYGDYVEIENRLAFDVEFYAKKLLKMAENDIGHFYPEDENGNKPIAYYWARVATCANPACRAEVPLLKQFYLCNKPNKKVHLKPIITGTKITFEIGKGVIDVKGWMGKSLNCPCCGNSTEVSELKRQSVNGEIKQKLIAVIKEGNKEKIYEAPTKKDINRANIDKSLINDSLIPNESMLKIPDLVSGRGWGIERWRDLFSNRQLLAMQTLVEKLNLIKEELNPTQNDYAKAIVTYLAILIDRLSIINTSFGRIDVSRENIQHPFARQAIPMMFDYPESNLFCNSTGSAKNQLFWIMRYIKDESNNPFITTCNNSASGDRKQFLEKELSSVITDPPYYDAIAYADLSDFFYVWLKRTLGDIYPDNFSTPQTPKTEECTALKHHHENSKAEAKKHFENKLLQIFSTIEKQTKGVVSIMFAHQSTEAWTTLVNSVLKANMNITGSWAISTEMGARMIALGNAALTSSVTVSCRPIVKTGYGDFKEISKNIESKIKDEVKELYAYGFRGADLLTACFGQAVSVFGQFEKVEKSDGTPVSVKELLEMAREAAFNAIISDIETDDTTRFYIGWLNLYGFALAEHDDVRRISQIGLNVDLDKLLSDHILIREKNKETLANYKTRNKLNKNLGDQELSYTINKAHKMMDFYETGERNSLVKYIGEHAGDVTDNVWRVLNSLKEILPGDADDYKQVCGLLSNSESLISEARRSEPDEDAPKQSEFDIM